MAKNIIIDTGFWYALYDKRDKYHEDANILSDDIDVHNLILPFPSLYETLNTRFIRHSNWLNSFGKYLKKKNVYIISDEKYRNSAFEDVWNLNRGRSYSLVDIIIRHMIADRNIRINALLTFNPGDFYDLCYKNNIEFLW